MFSGKKFKSLTTPILLFVALVLAGCATRGTDFDPNAVEQLKPSVTRLDDAVRLLGKPNYVTQRPDGTKVVQWIHVSVTPGSMSKKHLVVTFDKNNVMIQVAQQSQGNT